MHKTCYLKKAITLNVTGQKVNDIAKTADKTDIFNQKNNFSFNFYSRLTNVKKVST